MKKRHALLVLMLLCALGLTAQTRHWQHALQAGAGLIINDHGYRTETGLASVLCCRSAFKTTPTTSMPILTHP